MTEPNFLIIGAQKCGTTSLFHFLSQHPDLNLPSVKEIQFFSLEYSKGWKWYKNQFPENPFFRRKLKGEASPYYLFHPLVASRVATHLPKIKLIVMLRNPVDRAYSHFWHERKHKTENVENFETALELESERILEDEKALRAGKLQQSSAHQNFSYINRGFYAKQIEEWLRFFPLSQMLFIKSEDFFYDPVSELVKVYSFLGVKETLPTHLSPQNMNSYPLLKEKMRKKIVPLFEEDTNKLTLLIGEKFRWNLP